MEPRPVVKDDEPQQPEPGVGSQRAKREARVVKDRVVLYLLRGIFIFIAAGAGFYLWRDFVKDESLRVVTILGVCAVAVAMVVGEIFFSKAPIRTLAAISFGLIMGLVLSLVFQPVVQLVVNAIVSEDATQGTLEKISRFVQIIMTTAFCYYGTSVLLQTRDDFKFIIPYVEFRKEVKGHLPLILDTSTIIDGRVSGVLDTGILDRRLVVPRYVLNELQEVADSPDRSRRERGRRGLEILEELRRVHNVEIHGHDLPAGREVDLALLETTEALGGTLMTTDFNLQKRASVQGVPVVNMNDLATALKPVVVPGEDLRLELQRPGESADQAVGFLNDGTMVVVENASRKIGSEVVVEVSRTTQTAAGKLVFARLKQPSQSRRSGRGRGRRGSGESTTLSSGTS